MKSRKECANRKPTSSKIQFICGTRSGAVSLCRLLNIGYAILKTERKVTAVDWQEEARFCRELRELEAEERAKSADFEKEWGFNNYDVLDLDREIAMYILPRLAYFAAETDTVPNVLAKTFADEDKAVEEWHRILETICEGLHMYLKKGYRHFTSGENEIWHQSIMYLTLYFGHLWI